LVTSRTSITDLARVSIIQGPHAGACAAVIGRLVPVFG